MKRLLVIIVSLPMLMLSMTVSAQDDIVPSDAAVLFYDTIQTMQLPEISCDNYEAVRRSIYTLKLLNPPPNNVTHETVNDGAAQWFIPPDAHAEYVILYFHGGGYIAGTLDGGYQGYISRLALATGIRVLAVDYRLAPEHPYPAALEDALAGYHWLLDNDVAPEHIIIAGDSAGGNLTLTTLLSLRDAGAALPRAAVLISPWTDLTGQGMTNHTLAEFDPILTPDGLSNTAACYANGEPLDSPLISPLFGDFTDLPPLYIQVGSFEILLADSTRLARRARRDGVDVTLDVWDGMVHVWGLFYIRMPEMDAAFADMSAFIWSQLGD